MVWICRGLIQQRREPPMATSRALVTVPFWSRNFCRTAWGWGQGQRGWAHQAAPQPPQCLHLCLVLQSHVRGQQGHDRVAGRDVPLAYLGA